MTAQGIMNGAGSAMNAMFSGFPAVGGSVKGMQESTFEQFMETSKGGEKETSVTPTVTKSVRNEFAKPTDVKEQAKAVFTEKSSATDSASVTEDVTEVTPEEAEAVSTLLVQIQQVVCEALGITDEQLTATMEELGLQETDLLDRNNLQQIFLQFNQAEPTEFLTNEALFQEFSELMQTVEQMVEESGIAPEELKNVLATLKETEQMFVTETDNNAMVLEEEQPEERAEELPDSITATNGMTDSEVTLDEARTDSSETGEEQHLAKAKSDGDTTVISSEADADERNVFIDALASQGVNETGTAALEAAAQVREIANQIMEQIKITIRPEQTNMELQLNPEHLGRVNLTITEKEGMMTAQFTTQTEVAKEAIESQMAALRESLQNQGIKVEAIEVTVSEFGFERNEENGQRGNGEPEKRRKSGTFHLEEPEETTPQMTEYLNVTDSSVDYSA